MVLKNRSGRGLGLS